MKRTTFWVLRAILWNTAFYITAAVLAAYLGTIANEEAWQTSLVLLPLALLVGSCELFYSKKVFARTAAAKYCAGIDCGAKCFGYLFFVLAVPSVIRISICLGALMCAALFSYVTNIVMLMKLKKMI